MCRFALIVASDYAQAVPFDGDRERSSRSAPFRRLTDAVRVAGASRQEGHVCFEIQRLTTMAPFQSAPNEGAYQNGLCTASLRQRKDRIAQMLIIPGS